MKKSIETFMASVLPRKRASTPGAPVASAHLSPEHLRGRLIRDAFHYFLSKVLPGLMGFLSVVFFVRMVGVEHYGRFAVILAFIMAFASGLAGWLSQGILRFQSQWREPDDARNFLRSAVAGTIGSVGVGLLGLGAAIPAAGIQKGWPIVLSLALFAVLVIYTVTLGRLQASLRSSEVLRFEAIRSVGTLFLPLLLMWITRSRDYRLLLLGVALGYSLPLIEPILARAKSHVELAHRRRHILSAVERRVLSQLWRFGWPVALWMLCQQSMVVSDRFFLQKFVGYAAAGVYASMYDVIVRSFSLVFMPVTLAVHPVVMHRWNTGSRTHALHAIRSGMKYHLLMFIPVGICLAILAPWVSRIVLGKTNPEAAGIVLPLAAGGLLWQVCLLAHKPLEILCQTKRMLAGILVALAVNIAGNWLLVPRYAYRASAYLTVASSAVYLLLLIVLTPLQEFRTAVEIHESPRNCAAAEI